MRSFEPVAEEELEAPPLPIGRLSSRFRGEGFLGALTDELEISVLETSVRSFENMDPGGADEKANLCSSLTCVE